jgi:integrase
MTALNKCVTEIPSAAALCLIASLLIALARYVIEHEKLSRADPRAVPFEAVLIRYWECHAKGIRSADQGSYLDGLMVRSFSRRDRCRSYSTSPATLHWLDAEQGQPRLVHFAGAICGSCSSQMGVERGRIGISAIRFRCSPRPTDLEAERYRELNMKEVALLMGAAAKTPHLLKFCVIGLNTLARPEAILELGPDQVDLNRRLLNLNPPGRKQTKKYRPQVPITDTLLPWLIECNASRYILYRNSPIANIKGSFGKAAAEAGLQRVTPYCLRHTMATELRARSVPEWEVMGMLGHRNKATRTSERVREVPSKLPERGREGD